VVNFAAAIGWRQHTGREIFSLRDMTTSFDLGQIRRSCGGADPARLHWLSAKHLRQQPRSRLAEEVLPFLDDLGVPPGTSMYREQAIHLLLPYCRTHRDLAEQLCPLLQAPALSSDALNKLSPHRETLLAVLAGVKSLGIVATEHLRSFLQTIAQDRELTLRTVLDSVRLALYGSQASPDIFSVIALIGPWETARRVAKAAGVEA
jgi:glutamyl-tRNA synthetase